MGARKGPRGRPAPGPSSCVGLVSGGLHAMGCERADLTLGDVRRSPRPCSHQPGTLTTSRLGPGNRPSLPRHEESKPLCRAHVFQALRGPGRSWEAVRTGGYNWPSPEPTPRLEKEPLKEGSISQPREGMCLIKIQAKRKSYFIFHSQYWYVSYLEKVVYVERISQMGSICLLPPQAGPSTGAGAGAGDVGPLQTLGLGAHPPPAAAA